MIPTHGAYFDLAQNLRSESAVDSKRSSRIEAAARATQHQRSGNVAEIRPRPCQASATLFALPLRSLRSRGGQSASAATL